VGRKEVIGEKYWGVLVLGKPEVRRIATWQLGSTALAAIVFGLSLGASAAAASVLGGAIAMLANLAMALVALSGAPAAANRIIHRFYVAEASKILVTIFGFTLAFGIFESPAFPLLMTFALSLLAYWVTLAFVRRPLVLEGE